MVAGKLNPRSVGWIWVVIGVIVAFLLGLMVGIKL